MTRRTPTPLQTDRRRSIALLLALAFLLASITAPAVAATPTETPSETATDEGPTSAFEVRLLQDGSALVSLRMTFDLETQAERESFERLKANRENLTAAFADRMRRVAEATENQTGREMQVTDASASFSTIESIHTGVITVSVKWTNLASVEGDRLVLTEPFASNFQPDRRFIVTGPDGYRLAAVTPAPDARVENRAAWQAGTDLSGFKAVFAPTETEKQTPTKTSGPAPLSAALFAALVGLAVVGLRRR